MNKLNNKKLALLEILEESNTPLNIHEILHHLPNGFAERSVRRWLSELAKNSLIQKTGKKRGTCYSAKDVIYRFKEDSCFSDLSNQSIAKVRGPLFQREPVTYNEQWLKKYRPNTTYYLATEVRSKLLNEGKRSNQNEPAGTYAEQIFNRLLIDLSYNSSRLEGNTYSLLETEKLVLEGVGAQNKSEEEKIMILNHKEAIRFLVQSSSKLTPSKETLFTLHYLLSDGLVESKYCGHVRDHEVRIGGSAYIPLANPKKLIELLDMISTKASQINDPFEQSFFLLVHLSYLQAFTDVNKRTARLSANIALIKHNLVPLSFNDVGRDDYTSALLAIYEFQDIKPLIDLYVYSYKRTALLYDSTVHALGIDLIRVRYRSERRRLLGEIIRKKIEKAPLRKFIHREAQKVIPRPDLPAFIEDLQEDLLEMNETRLFGLGVTDEEFRAWRK